MTNTEIVLIAAFVQAIGTAAVPFIQAAIQARKEKMPSF
jgi:hypothetical protein